jgi:hypothetical protein
MKSENSPAASPKSQTGKRRKRPAEMESKDSPPPHRKQKRSPPLLDGVESGDSSLPRQREVGRSLEAAESKDSEQPWKEEPLLKEAENGDSSLSRQTEEGPPSKPVESEELRSSRTEEKRLPSDGMKSENSPAASPQSQTGKRRKRTPAVESNDSPPPHRKQKQSPPPAAMEIEHSISHQKEESPPSEAVKPENSIAHRRRKQPPAAVESENSISHQKEESLPSEAVTPENSIAHRRKKRAPAAMESENSISHQKEESPSPEAMKPENSIAHRRKKRPPAAVESETTGSHLEEKRPPLEAVEIEDSNPHQKEERRPPERVPVGNGTSARSVPPLHRCSVEPDSASLPPHLPPAPRSSARAPGLAGGESTTVISFQDSLLGSSSDSRSKIGELSFVPLDPSLRLHPVKHKRSIGRSAQEVDIAARDCVMNRRMRELNIESQRPFAVIRAIIQKNEWILKEAQKPANRENLHVRMQIMSALEVTREVIGEFESGSDIGPDTQFLEPADARFDRPSAAATFLGATPNPQDDR